MPLYDHLGSHKNIGLFIGKCRQNLFMPVLLPRSIHIHPQHSRLRKLGFHQLLDLLCPCPEFPDMAGAAFRADRRFAFLVPTIVANQLPVAVGRKRHIAVRAFDYMSAFPARDKSCISPAVQKQHDLLSLLQAIRDHILQFSAQNRPVALFDLFPQIHGGDLRHILHPGSVRHLQQAELPAFCTVHRLQGRGCRSQDHTGSLHCRPLYRSLPRMIPGHLLAFIRSLMLFVYHDQPQVWKRGK